LESFLGYSDRKEETVLALLETTEPFNATTFAEVETGAKYEAERCRPGLVISTDGSRTEGEATGYAVAWKKCQT